MIFLIGAALGLPTSASAHDPVPGQQPDSHHHGVLERGEQRMGFDQQTTLHNFVLMSDGGLVRVQAKSPRDHAAIQQIRGHLREIRNEFAKGNFEAPEFIHAKTPPGVSVMQQQKASIRYSYRIIAGGAELRISSKHANVVAAIHEFLKFQITDHNTGDSLQVRR
jgi:hypothetical protein